MRLDVAPQRCPTIAGFEAQRFGQAAIEIEPAEVGFGVIDHLVAMRVEFPGQAAQGSRLADTGLAGQEADAGRGGTEAKQTTYRSKKPAKHLLAQKLTAAIKRGHKAYQMYPCHQRGHTFKKIGPPPEALF